MRKYVTTLAHTDERHLRQTNPQMIIQSFMIKHCYALLTWKTAVTLSWQMKSPYWFKWGPSFILDIEVQNSEVLLNGRQFYGSVHLHRFSNPLERGHFHYQLPNATDPNIAQTLYVNIGGYKSTVYLHDQ